MRAAAGIHLHICIHLHLYIYMSTSTSTCIYTDTCMQLNVCMYLHLNLHVRIHLLIYTCMFVLTAYCFVPQFVLDTTPPKKMLEDEAMTLIQVELVPMAIVYVSFEAPEGMKTCRVTSVV